MTCQGSEDEKLVDWEPKVRRFDRRSKSTRGKRGGKVQKDKIKVKMGGGGEGQDGSDGRARRGGQGQDDSLHASLQGPDEAHEPDSSCQAGGELYLTRRQPAS